MPDPFDGDPPMDPGPWRPEPGSIAEARDLEHRQAIADTTARGLAEAREALANPPRHEPEPEGPTT